MLATTGAGPFDQPAGRDLKRRVPPIGVAARCRCRRRNAQQLCTPLPHLLSVPNYIPSAVIVKNVIPCATEILGSLMIWFLEDFEIRW